MPMTARFLPLILFAGVCLAQPGRPLGGGPLRWADRPYTAPYVPPVTFQNSDRIFALMRAGQLYLSLSDAIALTLENNLDIELERFLPKLADTELQRAHGGGLLRGLDLLVNEPAPGIGGPNGPLLTNLTAGSTPSALVNTNFSDVALISEQQNNLSITGNIPLVSGPPIPQYDPFLAGSFTWQHATTPEFSNILSGSNWLAANTYTGNTGWTQGFSSGAQINASFMDTRMSTNASRYTYDPILNASLGVTVTQPLLRGFGSSLNTRFIRIARNSQNIARLVFRQQVIDTVAGITRLYIDLVSLNEDVNVKRESLRLAERLFEDNRNQVNQGTLAPIEMTRAQAQVAASRQALISAEGLVRQQELIVKTAMTRAGLADPLIRDAHIVATDSVSVPNQEPVLQAEEQVSQALTGRPDLAQAALQVDSSRISLEGSLNALRPEVDLVGMMQNGGLSGPQNPQAGTSLLGLTTGGNGTALGQIFRRNYPTYSVGVQVTLPLRNRVAQADAQRDQLQVRQSQVRRQQLEDQVRLEVHDALVSLQDARAAYEASVQTRVLQEQSVKVEEQRFAVGISTNLEVIQFQSFLAQARSTEVASKGAYAKARTALERATGAILDTHHVSMDEAVRGQVGRPPAALPVK